VLTGTLQILLDYPFR